ncbi:acyl-CoA thioesterase [Halocalculus aciditolerans]|uniref:Acyl-CoA thioesterase n=1 Tax=Halocalculus aciditolerans TaxID=1383812 RepID=A0A830F3H2_9EURY|nr:acyl-CoA thioesterase [Halocalculus aciditolerans]GGL59444.1 acyl-CoA thioesterase [Halocalculus aciditolerans]
MDVLDTVIENRFMVQPNHANINGTCHGGNVMKWMDEVGAMSAMRFAGQPVVTARMNEVNFKRPVPIGDTAAIEAYVYQAGTTSVRVRLRAYAENPRTGEKRLTTESYFVYVAIDDDGEPNEVPPLTVDSVEGEELREDALTEEPDHVE